MEGPLLHEQSPAAYFKELLDSALARQHVTAGDLTAYYLVNLLCQFVRADACEGFGRERASRSRSGWRGRWTSPAPSSAPSCGASAISRCSSRASSPTAFLAVPWTSTTTSPWANTPMAR